MSGALKLHKTPSPTTFNDDFGLGLIAGMVTFTALSVAGAPFLAIAVGIIGGLIGKNKMIKESHEGKFVDKPTSFNKKAIIGGLNTYLLASLVLPWVGIAATPLVLGIAAVIGTLHGANLGRHEQQLEYNQALKEHEVAIIKSPHREHSIEPDLSGPPGRFVEKELQRRQERDAAIATGAVSGAMIP